MNFYYQGVPSASLTHRGRPYNVDLQRFTLLCHEAQRRQINQIPLDFSDNYSDAVFSMFIDLFSPSSNVPLDARFANELLDIIRDYDAPEIEQELERRILEKNDPETIVSYIKAAPDSFPGLFSYVTLHLDKFKTCKSLFDVPLSSLCRGFASQDAVQRPQQSKERHYTEIFEAIKDLKEQEMRLDREKEELDREVAEAKAKTTQLDMDNQRIQKLCSDTEREMNDLKQQLQEKKKMITALNEQLKQETKAQANAKKEADKASNDLQLANNKLKATRQQYEKLLHQ